MLQQNDVRKSKTTARQEVINQLLNGARNEVIYAEIHRDFLTDLKNNISEGKVDENVETVMFPNNQLEMVIENYNQQYNFSLEKLNFLKDLRKKENDKQAVKVAKKIQSTNLPELKVDLVREK